MSETEAHIGKLSPIFDLHGVGLEEHCRLICALNDFERNEVLHKTWVDCLLDEGYRHFIIYNDTVYKVEDEELDPNGFVKMEQNKDGTFSYAMSYYNGGASFTEVLEQGFAELEE